MFDKLTKAAKLEKGKKLFNDAQARDQKWQREAREDFEFRDGKQWTDDERSIMEEELRPILTFNLTKSSIDLIMGMNEDNRKIFRASPIDPTDGFLCEVLNDLAGWVQETNAFDEEEDAALESAAICGRGYVAIDFGPDPKRFGEIEMTEVEVSVHEVHFDPAARRANLEDAAYICWDRWMGIEDFKMRYPKITAQSLKELIATSRDWSLGDPTGLAPQSVFDPEPDSDADDDDYNRPLDLNFYDSGREMVRVIHMEYWEAFPRYYIWNPVANVFEESPDGKPSKETMELFKQEFGQDMVVESIMDKRVKWLQFTGDMILYDDVSPMPFPGFSIVPMFAYTDVSKRTMNHFGLVRLMKDPQREINKRWSQALNMLNNQVAPGIFAETDAFVDERQAKQSMKTSGDITWTNAGALTGGKIKERTVPTFPNAPMQMEQFSQDIMKKITGINPDLLGQDRGRQEPGVVIRLRQQQGVILLKPLFRNFNRLKKDLFKRQLSIIMQYMPDAQILRILGQNDRYKITPEGMIIDVASMNDQGQPTMVADLRAVRELEYNVGTEESPGNMAKRMLELSVLMEMMQAGFPVDPMQVIEKMEIAESEKKRWLDYIASQQQAQADQADRQMQFQMWLEKEKLRIAEQEDQMNFMVDIAKINQMAAKDEKRMREEIAKMTLEQRRDLGAFVTNLLNAMASVNQAEQQEKIQKLKMAEGVKKMTLDAASSIQDMQLKDKERNQEMDFREEQQDQMMKFNAEKNKQQLDAMKEKNRVAIELQRERGKAQNDRDNRRPSAKE